MPPKRGSRGRGIGEDAFGAHAGDRRQNISIAAFFDAASASTSSLRRGSASAPTMSTPPWPAGSAAVWGCASHAGSSAHVGNGHGLPSPRGEDGEERSSAAGGGYSSTLQEVHARVLAEVAEEQQAMSSGGGRGRHRGGAGGGAGPSRLHLHRQRALQIAFGSAAPGGCVSPPSQPRSSGRAGGSAEADEDDGLTVSSVEFSLLCPYSRLPMTYPVRSRDCGHVQCCDLTSWMVLLDKCRSLRDPKGPCPVCEQRVAASSLEVDVWMMSVMAQLPPGTRLVELDADGSYRNGDLTRARRRANITTEVIDATQEADYENYLGDVVDDSGELDSVEATVALASPTSARPAAREQLLASPLSVTAAQPLSPPSASSGRPAVAHASALEKRPRSPSPPLRDCSSLAHVTVKQERFLEQQQQQQQQSQVQTGPASEAVPPPELPSQESGVVLVHYAEGHPPRALPSRLRLWVPHCTRCGTPVVKGEDGQAARSCPGCGQTTPEQWSLVRRFEESGAATMELLPDDTLVLRGADGAAAYLFRAGFLRTAFAPSNPLEHRSPVGVWASSMPLTRVELDFLEACCQRAAAGEDVESLSDSVAVPALFRIPRRRRAGVGGSAGGYRSYGPTQPPPQQQQHQQAYGGGYGGGTQRSRTGWASPTPNAGLTQEQWNSGVCSMFATY